jgi:N-acetylglucosamine kinase-like BadF-type ATPase
VEFGMEKVFFLGIDGGASKTAGVICNSAGRILSRIRKGGVVVHAQPTPDSLAVLEAMVKELLAAGGVGADASWFCGLGLSGIDFADEIPSQIAAVEQVLGLASRRLKIVNDGIVALWGATPAEQAVMLQHGSGLTSAVRLGLGQERIFDCLDTANLFDLRDEAVHVVCRMIDGRRAPSVLKDRLLEHWQVSDERSFSELIYRGRIPWQRLRSCVPTVFECWQEGDLAAGELARRAAEDYADMVQAMLVEAGPSAEVALGGGVIAQAPERFWHLLAAHLRCRGVAAVPKKPALPPDLGAAVMACHHAGGDAAAMFAGLKRDAQDWLAKEKHAHH